MKPAGDAPACRARPLFLVCQPQAGARREKGNVAPMTVFFVFVRVWS